MAMDAQLKREQMQLDLHIAHEKLMADMAMEREKAQAQNALSVEKIKIEGAAKNEIDAGNPTIKSNVDLNGAVQTLAQGTMAVQQAIAAMTQIHQADVELVRDPVTGRAVGARKVMRQPPQETMQPEMMP
jgi:lipase chaperone LimK